MAKKPDDFIPVEDFPNGHPYIERGNSRCQAWSPRQGRQCLAIAMPNGKCRVHGGGALSGIAHPNYKDGRHVKNLPKRYLENYGAARSNPDYLKLQDEIALLDARLAELTGSIDEKASYTIFSELNKTVSAMEKARAALLRSQNIKDEERCIKASEKANMDFMESISEIARLVKTGSKEWYIWQDITSLIESRRRLVETERKLLVDMQILVNTQDVMILLDALMESVRRNVTDRNTRQSIQTDFNRLMR